jgi:hypothetical protein
MVSLGVPNAHHQTLACLRDVLNPKGDQLATAERARKAQQNQQAVMHAPIGLVVERPHELADYRGDRRVNLALMLADLGLLPSNALHRLAHAGRVIRTLKATPRY